MISARHREQIHTAQDVIDSIESIIPKMRILNGNWDKDITELENLADFLRLHQVNVIDDYNNV